MKVLQINVWGGRIKDGLSRFIAEGKYDVICMQEAVWSDDCNEFLESYIDTVDKIQRLAGFEYALKTSNYGTNVLSDGSRFELGNAILSRIPFTSVKERCILGEYTVTAHASDYKTASGHSYTAQKAILDNGIAIVNYHGYWQKDPIGNKTTIACMRKVVEFIRDDTCPTIMCGDLNLVSESPAMRELDFMRDLTAVNHVKTTLRNIRFIKDVACDHILITDELESKSFEAINAPVSDHMALVAEIGRH